MCFSDEYYSLDWQKRKGQSENKSKMCNLKKNYLFLRLAVFLLLIVHYTSTKLKISASSFT